MNQRDFEFTIGHGNHYVPFKLIVVLLRPSKMESNLTVKIEGQTVFDLAI